MTQLRLGEGVGVQVGLCTESALRRSPRKRTREFATLVAQGKAASICSAAHTLRKSPHSRSGCSRDRSTKPCTQRSSRFRLGFGKPAQSD